MGWLLLLIILCYATWVEPAGLRVVRRQVALPKRQFKGTLRVLFLSDWHLGRFGALARLPQKFEQLYQVHQREPFDLILLGGDYLDAEASYTSQLPELLAILARFKLPMVGVLGNHDYSSTRQPGQLEALIKAFERGGVELLRNQSCLVKKGDQHCWILGLDDLQEVSGYRQSERYQSFTDFEREARKVPLGPFANHPKTDLRIVLSHNPDGVLLNWPQEPDLVLAGHTHGGQLCLVDWLAQPLHRLVYQVLPPGSFGTWAGDCWVEGRRLIVSRGLGEATLPLRLLRPPEATIVEISGG